MLQRHKHTPGKMLLEVPGLMVLQQTWDDPAIAPTQQNVEIIRLDAAAAALLQDYLKVSKAFFGCGHPANMLRSFQTAIAQRLGAMARGVTLQRSAVSQVIAQLGCVTDWQQQYPATTV